MLKSAFESSSWTKTRADITVGSRQSVENSTRAIRRRAASLAVLLVLASFVMAMVIQPAAVSCAAQAEPPTGESALRADVLASANGTLIANAGLDRSVVQGIEITLDASASTGNITNYTWTFDYGGLHKNITGKTVRFTFSVSGVYDVTLNVTDGKGNYSTDQVVITVEKPKVNILATYWQEIVGVAIVVGLVAFFYAAMTGKIKFIPDATQEKMKLGVRRWRKIISQVFHNAMGLTGVIILVFFIAMAILGPTLAPEKIDPTINGPFKQFERPSPQHWMGTDVYSYDIFSELLYGARTSIIVGVFSAIIASVLGALVGLYSGYVGGWKDEVIMRANDVVLSIPWLVLMIVVAALLQKIDLTGIILIIGLTGWSTTARMVRASVLSIKERQFVERARAIGASDMAIIRRHIMPNAFPLVFANTILTVAISILSEATLSFLGLRPVNTITWGTMLSRASESDAFHIGLQAWIVVPGLCIVAVVLGFTLLGYALDDIMNPKLRKR